MHKNVVAECRLSTANFSFPKAATALPSRRLVGSFFAAPPPSCGVNQIVQRHDICTYNTHKYVRSTECAQKDPPSASPLCGLFWVNSTWVTTVHLILIDFHDVHTFAQQTKCQAGQASWSTADVAFVLSSLEYERKPGSTATA